MGLTKRERIMAMKIMKVTGMDKEKCYLCVRHSRGNLRSALEMCSSESPEGERS